MKHVGGAAEAMDSYLSPQEQLSAVQALCVVTQQRGDLAHATSIAQSFTDAAAAAAAAEGGAAGGGVRGTHGKQSVHCSQQASLAEACVGGGCGSLPVPEVSRR
jgi:hypothetical protein